MGQHYQLHKPVQVVQVSCHLHTPLWLWNMDPACWLKKKKKRIQAYETKCLRKFPCISYLEHKTNGWINFLLGQQDQLPFGSAETFSGNCCETETCMVWACHTSRQPLQKHPSGHLGGWATLWSAEEMLLKEWTCLPMPELLTMASCRKHWKTISAESSVLSPWWTIWSVWTEMSCLRKFSLISFSEQKTDDWVRSEINVPVGPQEPPLATVNRQKVSNGSSMSHAMIASTKPSFRPHWRVGNTAEEMLEGQHQKMDIPACAGTAHDGPMQRRLEEDPYCIVPQVSTPPTPSNTNEPTGQGTELRWWSIIFRVGGWVGRWMGTCNLA